MSEEKKGCPLFLVSQPGKSQTPRIRLWQTFKAFGAAVLWDGIYLLPRYPALQTAFDK